MTEKATKRGLMVAGRRYLAAGFSILPCHADKKPAKGWRELQIKRADNDDVYEWYMHHGYQSIGLIGGHVSGNVVFIDLDGIKAIQMFAKAFPTLCETTHSVLTGSQKGIHLYVRVDEIPDNINVRVDGIGGFEIRGDGQYVIAPPSPHPSGYQYRVHRNHLIQRLPHIHDVRAWMDNLRADVQSDRQAEIARVARPQRVAVDYSKRAYLSKVLGEEIARVETAHAGNRNQSLFYAGLRLANYVAGGELQWSDTRMRLLQAGCAIGLPRKEVERTLDSAWNIGSRRPKTVK